MKLFRINQRFSWYVDFSLLTWCMGMETILCTAYRAYNFYFPFVRLGLWDGNPRSKGTEK